MIAHATILHIAGNVFDRVVIQDVTLAMKHNENGDKSFAILNPGFRMTGFWAFNFDAMISDRTLM